MVLTVEQIPPKVVAKIKELFSLHYTAVQIKHRITNLGFPIELELVKELVASFPVPVPVPVYAVSSSSGKVNAAPVSVTSSSKPESGNSSSGKVNVVPASVVSTAAAATRQMNNSNSGTASSNVVPASASSASAPSSAKKAMTAEQIPPKILAKIQEMFALHHSPVQIKHRIANLGFPIELDLIKEVTGIEPKKCSKDSEKTAQNNLPKDNNLSDKPPKEFTKSFDGFNQKRQLFLVRRYLAKNYKSHQKLTTKALNGGDLTWWAFPKRHPETRQNLKKSFPKDHFYEMVNYFSGDAQSGLRLLVELIVSFPGASTEFSEEAKKLLAKLPKPPRKRKKKVSQVEVEESEEENATTLNNVVESIESMDVVKGDDEDDDLPPLKFQKTAHQEIPSNSPEKNDHEKFNRAGGGGDTDADDENEEKASRPNKVPRTGSLIERETGNSSSGRINPVHVPVTPITAISSSSAPVVREKEGGNSSSGRINPVPVPVTATSSSSAAVVREREGGNSSSGRINPVHVPVTPITAISSSSAAVVREKEGGNSSSGRINPVPVPVTATSSSSAAVVREREGGNSSSGRINPVPVPVTATSSSSAAVVREKEGGNSSSGRINPVPVPVTATSSSSAAVVRERDDGSIGSAPLTALASLASAAAIVQRNNYVDLRNASSYQPSSSQLNNRSSQELQDVGDKNQRRPQESSVFSFSQNTVNPKGETPLTGDKRKRES